MYKRQASNDHFEFTTLYCPNGKSVEHEDYPNKLRWYESLAAHLEATPNERRIVCGDFNIVPHHIDSWRGASADGDVFHTTEERARFEGLMNTGLTDLFRERYPEEAQFSWWDYRGGAFHRRQGLRIDFVLGTPAIAEQISDVVIDRDYRKKQDGLTASDHAPVFADLAL